MQGIHVYICTYSANCKPMKYLATINHFTYASAMRKLTTSTSCVRERKNCNQIGAPHHHKPITYTHTSIYIIYISRLCLFAVCLCPIHGIRKLQITPPQTIKKNQPIVIKRQEKEVRTAYSFSTTFLTGCSSIAGKHILPLPPTDSGSPSKLYSPPVSSNC